MTGSGHYYCSGNDLSNFTNSGGIPNAIAKARQALSSYVAAYINHKKVLIALVNGPAIGIAVTVLPLFDLVVASDKVY